MKIELDLKNKKIRMEIQSYDDYEPSDESIGPGEARQIAAKLEAFAEALEGYKASLEKLEGEFEAQVKALQKEAESKV